MTAPYVPRQRTNLSPMQERIFRQWYAEWAQKAGIDPNPDNPLHKYDYRGAFMANATPVIDSGDSLYHWPSAFKDDDHPNRFVKGVGDSKSLDRSGGLLANAMMKRPAPVQADAVTARGRKKATSTSLRLADVLKVNNAP